MKSLEEVTKFQETSGAEVRLSIVSSEVRCWTSLNVLHEVERGLRSMGVDAKEAIELKVDEGLSGSCSLSVEGSVEAISSGVDEELH